MPGYVSSAWVIQPPSNRHAVASKRKYNHKLANALGLNRAQKNLVKFICKEYTRFGRYDKLMNLISYYLSPWELLVALASRSGVQTPDQLYRYLKPFKNVTPLRDCLPWRTSVKVLHKRNHIQLIKVNGNTKQSLLLPYYFKLPHNGRFQLKETVLKDFIAIDSNYFKVQLSEHDSLLCQDGLYYIILDINGVHLQWPDDKVGITNFAFRTTRMSWIDMNCRKITIPEYFASLTTM